MTSLYWLAHATFRAKSYDDNRRSNEPEKDGHVNGNGGILAVVSSVNRGKYDITYYNVLPNRLTIMC